ncbi:hypothetical protein L9F63_012945, partial [Diploptera punctata]
MVLFYSYSASIISRIAINRYTLPFKDLKGLLQDGTYKFSISQNTADLTRFQNTTEGIEYEVDRKLIQPYINDMPATNYDGIKRVCDTEKYTFLGSNLVGKIMAANYSCQLLTLPDVSYPEILSCAISKNNPYKKVLNW